MLLSKLVYQAIKNVTFYDDTAFTYEAFLQGKYDNDSDYANAINNIFIPINEALARLSDLERVPYVIESVSLSQLQDKGILPLSALNKEVKQVMGIAQLYGAQARVLEFHVFGLDKIRIADYIDESKPIYVEYKEDIPHFDRSNFRYNYVENANGVLVLDQASVEDVNLREYGINDSIANYIMEYAMGKLSEQISPELANMHITRSEQYFVNVNPVKASFVQTGVSVKFGIN